jgi:hypothetical protein
MVIDLDQPTVVHTLDRRARACEGWSPHAPRIAEACPTEPMVLPHNARVRADARSTEPIDPTRLRPM